MPNRILKESICTSEKISELSDFNFRLWASLITYVDDYGRGDARPAIIKGRCFPLRERVTAKQISDGLSELAETGCIQLYQVDGGAYLYFPNWERHQRIRQKVSKYPEPTTRGNSPQLAATCSGARPESESESEYNPNPNTEAEYEDDAAPDRLIIYATDNLKCLSANNLKELDSFREQLTDEMIIWAIDETSAKGSRNYGYLKAILNRMIDQGLKTIGDVKAYEEKRRREKQQPEQMKRARQTAKLMDERELNPAEFEPDYSELMNRPRSGGAA